MSGASLSLSLSLSVSLIFLFLLVFLHFPAISFCSSRFSPSRYNALFGASEVRVPSSLSPAFLLGPSLDFDGRASARLQWGSSFLGFRVLPNATGSHEWSTSTAILDFNYANSAGLSDLKPSNRWLSADSRAYIVRASCVDPTVDVSAPVPLAPSLQPRFFLLLEGVSAEWPSGVYTLDLNDSSPRPAFVAAVNFTVLSASNLVLTSDSSGRAILYRSLAGVAWRLESQQWVEYSDLSLPSSFTAWPHPQLPHGFLYFTRSITTNPHQVNAITFSPSVAMRTVNVPFQSVAMWNNSEFVGLKVESVTPRTYSLTRFTVFLDGTSGLALSVLGAPFQFTVSDESVDFPDSLAPWIFSPWLLLRGASRSIVWLVDSLWSRVNSRLGPNGVSGSSASFRYPGLGIILRIEKCTIINSTTGEVLAMKFAGAATVSLLHESTRSETAILVNLFGSGVWAHLNLTSLAFTPFQVRVLSLSSASFSLASNGSIWTEQTDGLFILNVTYFYLLDRFEHGEREFTLAPIFVADLQSDRVALTGLPFRGSGQSLVYAAGGLELPLFAGPYQPDSLVARPNPVNELIAVAIGELGRSPRLERWNAHFISNFTFRPGRAELELLTMGGCSDSIIGMEWSHDGRELFVLSALAICRIPVSFVNVTLPPSANFTDPIPDPLPSFSSSSSTGSNRWNESNANIGVPSGRWLADGHAAFWLAALTWMALTFLHSS